MFEGNKVNEIDIAMAIKDTQFILLPDGRTTICMLTLDNGFTVRGESSCVDIANYNQTKGETIAFDNARGKVWQLLGFRLADRLAEDGVYMDALEACDFRLWQDPNKDGEQPDHPGIPLAVSTVVGTVVEGPTIFLRVLTPEKTH